MIKKSGVITSGQWWKELRRGDWHGCSWEVLLQETGSVAEEVEMWMDFGLTEVSEDGCFDVRGEVVPLIGILGDAEGGVSDTDKEAHQGDAFGWRAIKISDFVPSFERGSKRDEGRVVVGSGEPTDRNPWVVDEVEVVHEILKVEVFLDVVVAGGFGGGFFVGEAGGVVIVENMRGRGGMREFKLWSVISGDGQKGVGNVLGEPVASFREASLDEVAGDADGIEVKGTGKGETELPRVERDGWAVNELQGDLVFAFDRRRFEEDEVASGLDPVAGFFALDIGDGAGEDVALFGSCPLLDVLMFGIGEEAGDGGVGIWLKFVGGFESAADFVRKDKVLCFGKMDRCLPEGKRWINEAMGRELRFNFL